MSGPRSASAIDPRAHGPRRCARPRSHRPCEHSGTKPLDLNSRMEKRRARRASRKTFGCTARLATAFRMLLAAVVQLSGDEPITGMLAYPDWSYFRPASDGDLAMRRFACCSVKTSLAVRMPAIIARPRLGLAAAACTQTWRGYRERHTPTCGCARCPCPGGLVLRSTDVAMRLLPGRQHGPASPLAQGRATRWWGFGLALGLASLAKFRRARVIRISCPR